VKTLSDAVKAKIANNLGIEPVSILEVQWGNATDGPWTNYADKDIKGYEYEIKGKILELTNLESVVKLDMQGQTQGLNVKLSDSGGELKAIFDSIDLHGKRCKLYQWFEGLLLEEKFKLYEGKISSPITWSEGDRTLSFEVITELTDKEVGFSPEEGYFEYLPESAYGKPWPLVFGKVQNLPAVRLSEIPNTLTIEPLSATDPTLAERIAELEEKATTHRQLFSFYALATLQAAYTCSYGDTPEQRQNGCSAEEQLETVLAEISLQISQIDQEIEDLKATKEEQDEYQNTTLETIDITGFPTGSITLQSGNIRMQGSFNGQIFNIDDLNLTNYDGYDGTPFGFTWQKEGTTITIQSDAPIVYVINLITSTVSYVSAYKQVDNGVVLASVPTEYYSVETEDIGPYTITYLTFDIPLSSRDETFQDDIYVTLESNVGPNTVDILEWLISTYTDMSVDSTSFDYVKTKLENYPSHFALQERQNILTVLEDIAFQARCAIWISDRIFYIRYLPEELSADATLTEAKVDSGSLVVRSSTTEDLVTKLVARWTDDYTSSDDNLIILRHNVNKYGTREREINFYIYNIFDLVMKSATFWLIRLSNAWKHLDFTVYLDSLELETFDVVNFNFTENFVSDSAIKGILTAVNYDSSNQVIQMSAWLPIKCGSMSRYDFAEPHDISVDLYFPTEEEIENGSAGGNGLGEDVEGGVELTDAIRKSFSYTTKSTRLSRGERIQGRDYGELTPSDLDDTKPTPDFVGRGVNYIPEPEYNYIYPDYDITRPDITEENEYSFSFPAKITAAISTSLYAIDVYKYGLSGAPQSVTATQLQIVDELIPVNTWVLVAYNRWVEDDEIKEEYTMQVPVWL
jgi:hypothetical protein